MLMAAAAAADAAAAAADCQRLNINAMPPPYADYLLPIFTPLTPLRYAATPSFCPRSARRRRRCRRHYLLDY